MLIFTPHLIASTASDLAYNKNAYGLFNTVLGWFHILFGIVLVAMIPEQITWSACT